ncbi:MAG TPA: glycosyltransferase family 2 protein [Patescibacteria group bacterium]|nr:glycosyltransferase family 2 protein [Patescibacteria group bacterium]
MKLSIIILNHNTKELLSNCLKSILTYKNEIPLEVIVSDNASTDGSLEMVKNKFSWVKLIQGPNISFSNGNNRAKGVVKGEYILLLNSDTLIQKDVFKKTVEYLEQNTAVGALTCKLVLLDGTLDKDARRRFPTPWISFNRLFLGNGKLYWYEDIPSDMTHEVDAIEGAFFLTRKEILDKVGWLDEKFIFDGEDLDLSFQIKKSGYKIIYFGEASIIHLKKASRSKLTDIQIKRKMEGVNSMEYFYRKNLWSRYPLIFNYFVILGIKILKLIRFIQK